MDFSQLAYQPAFISVLLPARYIHLVTQVTVSACTKLQQMVIEWQFALVGSSGTSQEHIGEGRRVCSEPALRDTTGP